jgi:hypothetical protein
MCIEERLPPGAAAVLSNQSHTYTDLILPIDAAERRLFEAIDGQRTITEILDNIPVRGGAVRVGYFFEKLWWHDQVVFDAIGYSLSQYRYELVHLCRRNCTGLQVPA